MFKKPIISLAAITAALVLSAGSSGAITIVTDGSVTSGLIDINNSINGVFDLTSDYNSSADTLNSAYVDFVFQDRSQKTALNVSIDGSSVTTGQIVNTFLTYGGLSFNVAQIALTDSLLSYSITWSSGDGINLVDAKLTADITRNAANSVPDGGMTLGLLGLALAGLGMARRQFQA